MSSRQLRRLGNDDLESTLKKLASKAASKNDEEEGNCSMEKAQKSSGTFNPFLMMGEDDENDSEMEKEDEDTEANDEDLRPKISLTTKSQRKKNKKNKKKQKGGHQKHIDDERLDGVSDDEEFDRLLQQFQKKNLSSHAEKDDYEDDGFITAEEDALEEDLEQETKMLDLRDDPGFSKFKSFQKLFELFSSFDFKDLVPDNEFRMLFDDLAPETLHDIDSVTSTHVSPQVLKQIERMRRLVKNWSGKDKRSVPNGGSVRKLQFTKIRDDWLPSLRGELNLKKLSKEELVCWQKWERPNDWESAIQNDVERKWNKHFDHYKFEPLNDTANKKALTEFYLSAVLRPDHEALISLISSQFPYHIPGLLQVALICIRQGDKSNSNGLVERALFVFDRCLKNGIEFNAKGFQLPYIFFYNRQFYLAILRYIQIVFQRGAISTAAQWCKTLLSLSPLEDPMGVRYFIDYYLSANNEYMYMIKLITNPASYLYKQWFTLGLGLSGVYAYLQLDCANDARELLKRVWNEYPYALSKVFSEILLGDSTTLPEVNEPSITELIETKSYISRMRGIWKDNESIKFLHNELLTIFATMPVRNPLEEETEKFSDSPFFIQNIPINLLRFTILSQESSLMAIVPQFIWSDYSVFEFDVLPPTSDSKETNDTVESIETIIDKRHLEISQMQQFADEELLQRINEISLQEYLEQQQQQQHDREDEQ